LISTVNLILFIKILLLVVVNETVDLNEVQ